MANKRLGLVGRLGELKWETFDMRTPSLPVPRFDHVYNYASMRLFHPYREERFWLIMCVENDDGYSRRVGRKAFIDDYLRSGKCLYIYPLRRGVKLSRNLIYLDFIFDILGEKLQKEVTDAKKPYLIAIGEKLQIDDSGPAAIGADDDIDYH